ncbi:MAG: hypothetical protein D6771_02875, partial [Zetaproteobacteria bacterium]
MRVALVGGVFDPPHLAHRAMIRFCARWFDEVWVVPAGIPAHRRVEGIADPERRARWAAAMIRTIPRARLLRWEVERRKPTPTIETLTMLAERYPGVRWVLAIGADEFAALPRWVRWPEHASFAAFLVFARVGVTIAGDHGLVRRNLAALARAPQPGTYALAPAPPAVSSTALRAQLARGDPSALG